MFDLAAATATVTSEVAVSFLSEVIAQIWLDIEVVEKLLLNTFFNKSTPSCHFWPPRVFFWPPTAFLTSEVKNYNAYVITQHTCNKLIQVKFCVGCMVWWPNRLVQHWTSFDYLINNRRMFNGKTDDLAIKPYFSHKTLLQWICCKCFAW